MARRGSRRGFSLTELAVVLGVLILAAAIIFPSIGALKRQGRLRVGAATVAESLRTARSLAIAQSAAYSVDFAVGQMPHPELDKVCVYRGARTQRDLDCAPVLPEGVKFVAPIPTVSFSPDGSCSANVEVRIRDAAKGESTITVKAANGRIAVTGGAR